MGDFGYGGGGGGGYRRGGYVDDGGGYRGGRGGRSNRGGYYEDRQQGGFGGAPQYYDGRQGGGFNNNNNYAGRGGGFYDSGNRGGRGYYEGGGGRGGNYYDGSASGGGRSSGYEGRGRGRYHNNWGRGGQRSNSWVRPEREEAALPADLKALVELPAHSKKVSAICIDPAAQQMYTGSYDGSVKCWSTSTGQCVHTLDAGGPVDSLLVAGGFLFVGVQKGTEGLIKIWDMATGANHQLPGHKGQIYAMVTAASALFSAGQDGTIRVWNFNAAAHIFMSQAIISKDEGGHSTGVHALTTFGNWLFSADRKGIIKVWDLSSGKVAQSIEAHTEVIMQLLVWDSYILSASMDGTIKAWQVQEQPVPGVVLKTEPEFVFDKDMVEQADQQFRRPRGARPASGILTMQGTLDAQGTAILLVPYLGENFVRLYELPTFATRGVLTPAADTRCIGSMLSPEGKGQIVMAGDESGKLRIFQWLATGAPAAPIAT